jgi:hypothetical protein
MRLRRDKRIIKIKTKTKIKIKIKNKIENNLSSI